MTKYKLHIFAFLFCFPFQFLLSQDVLITGGWRFDSNDKRIEPNDSLFIKNGVFSDLSPSGNYKIIRLTADEFILPGLIDLHAHYRIAYDNKEYDDTVAMPKIFLANGVTTTFPAGEIEPGKMLDLSKAIHIGNRTGARILNSGPYYGGAAPDWNKNFTKEDIEARVDLWAKMGAKGFKAKNITPENLQVLIDRAHFHGLTVTAHLNSGINNSVNPQDAVKMGIDRVEHFLGGRLIADTAHAYYSLENLDPSDPILDEVIQEYIKNDVYFDATLATYGAIGLIDGPVFQDWAGENKYLSERAKAMINDKDTSDFSRMSARIYPIKAKVLKRFYDSGGLITVGTDRPLLFSNYLGRGIGGFFIHREMHAMVKAGIPEKEVLFFATLQNARAIKIADKAGSFDSGKWGDAVIIKGNPLEEITNTRNIQKVIKSGIIYDPERLLKSVEGKLGPE